MTNKNDEISISVKVTSILIFIFIILLGNILASNYSVCNSKESSSKFNLLFGRPYCGYKNTLKSILLKDNNFQKSDILVDEKSTNSKESILDNIKEPIVWIKYKVTGKNFDGSYFKKEWSGSGVIVSNQKEKLLVYTNRHVVDCEFTNECFQRIYEEVYIRTQNGKMHKVDRVSFSKSDIDLAVLEINLDNSRDYNFAYYTGDFDINDKVIAVGYPSYAKNVVEFSIAEGKITDIKDVLSGSTGKSFRTIESDAYTFFGSSGGGLFNSDGALVGINTWGSEGDSIAIDFNSIKEESLIHCNSEGYYAEGKCYKFCDKDEVRGYNNRICYSVCDEFYCDSQIPIVTDRRCKDKGYILGSDGYCHQPCSSINSYCQAGSICLRNQCYPPCSQGYLWEDGSCRFYE